MAWYCPNSEGTVEGERISFVVLGQLPSSDGYPRMRFTGTVHGDEIQLTMILFYSDERTGKTFQSEFQGKRIPK